MYIYICVYIKEYVIQNRVIYINIQQNLSLINATASTREDVVAASCLMITLRIHFLGAAGFVTLYSQRVNKSSWKDLIFNATAAW